MAIKKGAITVFDDAGHIAVARVPTKPTFVTGVSISGVTNCATGPTDNTISGSASWSGEAKTVVLSITGGTAGDAHGSGEGTPIANCNCA